MKRTELFSQTSKTTLADEVAKNAQLLIRAGFIHKEMAGVYAYLPLGLRVLEKIKQIVREEMNAVGGQEVMMTALQPAELFIKTNRWDDAVVDNWFKTHLKNGTELGLGLTHEEPITNLLRENISSYKNLPVLVYQIQNKFRNEKRAKSGLLRGREFVMKDMYSFARTAAEHDEIYERVAAAYKRVYERLGLGADTYRVAADGGYFTDKNSDEYQTLCTAGEDTLYHVPGTDIWYNEEIAPAALANEGSSARFTTTGVNSERPEPRDDGSVFARSAGGSVAEDLPLQSVELLPLEIKDTTGAVGVAALVEFLGVPTEATTKSLIYKTDRSEVVLAVVRGDREVNEIKLRKVVGAKSLTLADEETVRQTFGAEIGAAGLLNVPTGVRVIVDDSCAELVNFETGANRTHQHAVNVNWGRDVARPAHFYDIKLVRPGDLHPESGQVYEVHQGSEVGNIFPLESKYPDALGFYYLDEAGKQQHVVMGCYGIGISRVMGVLAEKFSDEAGLRWPEAVAPFRAYLVNIGAEEAAAELYKKCVQAGIEVLWDDRAARPGEKFADADLFGIPYRLTVSERTAGKVELKKRGENSTELLTVEEILAKLV